MTDTNTPEQKLETLEDLREQVQDADKLADTPFSELFHEARTSNQIYNKINCYYQIDPDTGSISQLTLFKLQQGEHILDHPNAADFSASLPRKPSMTTEYAKQLIVESLRLEIDRAKQNALNQQ